MDLGNRILACAYAIDDSVIPHGNVIARAKHDDVIAKTILKCKTDQKFPKVRIKG